MAVTGPTFTKLRLHRQQFVRNSYIEFQEKLIENIVTATLSRTDGRTQGCEPHMKCSSFKCLSLKPEPIYIYIYTHTHTHTHTGCPRRNLPDFGRVFLMLNYTDITQNTYIRS